MAQFLRPDSNVTQTSFTGGFADIDEATASNTDFAYGANNTAATLEVGLSNPSGTPGGGTTTVRYRVARTNGGVVTSDGNACDIQCHVYQGTTLIASDTAKTVTGTWTDYSFTPSMASVTDWNDLRLRFVTTASGGSPANRRGAAVSWAEIEAPDAGASNPAISTLTDNFGSGSLDTNKWTASNTNGTVSIVNGELDLVTTGAAGTHATITSVGTYSLDGSEIYVKVVRPCVGTTDIDGQRTILRVYDSATGKHGDYVESWIESNGFAGARTCDNGGIVDNGDFTTDWATSGFAWLKISKSGGTVTWWTAPDNGGVPGTWTSRRTYSSLPSNFTSVKVAIWLEGWSANPGTITQSARFDGVNTAVSSGAVTGTMSVSDSGTDTWAGNGKVYVKGSLAATDAYTDTASSSGVVKYVGALNATDSGSDSFASTGAVKVQGALSVSDSGTDTFSATGLIGNFITGSLSASDAYSDTFASTGNVRVAGSMAATDSVADTFAAPGAVKVQGTLVATDSVADTVASTGAVKVAGALAATDSDSDTFSAPGSVKVQGALAVTDAGSDTLACTGAVRVVGALSATDAYTDNFISNGGPVILGPLIATDDYTDTFAATGGVVVKGHFYTVEDYEDSFAATGNLPVIGTLSVTEAETSIFTASGTVLVKGALLVTDSGSDLFVSVSGRSPTLYPLKGVTQSMPLAGVKQTYPLA